MHWRAPVLILACGGVILGLALGTRQSFGLFLRPMSLELGWGREAFSFAIALQNLVWGCAMPFLGAVADRYGAGRVLTAGGLAYGAGLLAMAYSTTLGARRISSPLPRPRAATRKRRPRSTRWMNVSKASRACRTKRRRTKPPPRSLRNITLRGW